MGQLSWAQAFRTSADNYVVQVEPRLTDPAIRRVVVASAICIDMALKEGGR